MPQLIFFVLIIFGVAYCAVPAPTPDDQPSFTFGSGDKGGKSDKVDSRWTRSKYAVAPSQSDDRAAGGNELATGETVVLRQQRDGHYYTRANVDGGEVHFMVDTGATGIALTGEDARNLGLSWNDSELQPVGRGAGGALYGKPVTLGSVSVGGFTVNNVQAVILPNGLDVSLLGQSFLSSVPNVNISNGQMTLQ
ncbi:retropepsin-like aspartic protease family protein [Sphingorhabdus arenilitoris]|uniref:retropepsin-like aspartic protease family protein n=1 Tax=Sphingorhabdus arenilitoris TaxID=1490041 RepID=UPI0036D3618E